MLVISSYTFADSKTKYKDQPITTSAKSLDSQIKPYVEMAKKSYPKAKERFMNGLGNNYSFYVIIRIYDEKNNFEQIFLVVDRIRDGYIHGRLSNNPTRVKKYKRNDKLSVREENIYDWVIVDPKGEEEGNFVGRYIDAIQNRYLPLIIKITIDKDGSVSKSEFSIAVTQQKQDISYIIPQEIQKLAENKAKLLKFKSEGKTVIRYTYFIYDIHKNQIIEKKK